MDKYSVLLTQLNVGVVISFKEYTLDRHEKKKLSCSIENTVVQEVIPPNHPMSIDDLVKYYGNNLDTVEYLQLSSINCLRVVVITGMEEITQQPQYKVLLINQDFCNSGLQEVTVISDVSMNNPVYLEEIGKQFPSQIVNF